MDTRTVIVIGFLVLGAVVAGYLHLEQLSGVLAGAAAGLAVPAKGVSTQIKSVAPLGLAIMGGAIAPYLLR